MSPACRTQRTVTCEPFTVIPVSEEYFSLVRNRVESFISFVRISLTVFPARSFVMTISISTSGCGYYIIPAFRGGYK